MGTQYGYQDRHGTFYPDHPALRFEPGLVPGFYDTDSKTFEPTGNPNRQTGTIITDAGFGGSETLKSGLSEDKGADTAPLKGVVFTQTNDEAQREKDTQLANAQSENADLKRQLEDSNRENAQLRAKEELARASASAHSESTQSGETADGDESGQGEDDGPGDTATSKATRRARRART